MKKILKTLSVLFLAAMIAGCTKDNNDPAPVPDPDPDPDPDPPVEEVEAGFPAAAWTATYADNQSIDFNGYPAPRDKKTVGIFYFIWHGAHGYDYAANNESIVPPTAADTRSPYDINLMLQENPADPQYGPVHAFHHWGKPYLDYYVANDEWVLRKHAQMLTDAGVDVIILDVTNGFKYISTVKVISDLYLKMREEGNKTPQLAFMLNSAPENNLPIIYSDYYQKYPEYEELWFKWDGKPLVLTPDANYGSFVSFFTRRHSWFDTRQAWFGSGYNKWPWGDLYPQRAGNSSTSSKEATSVMPATHPTSNIGRSHNGSFQPLNPTPESSAAGTYFKLQCQRALDVDPDFVFITGWNEWVAMRFVDGAAGSFLGKPISAGDTYFVDQYNHEYSRDIEPIDGGFGDNYYYYMVDFIRKYKGVKATDAVTEYAAIGIDGDMADWNGVETVYADDKGDVAARNHFGWGRLGTLTNNTGRNDILRSKVASDAANIYFYVQTDRPITSHDDPMWMRLFIDVAGSGGSKWEGLKYVVNNSVNDDSSTNLEVCSGGWNWGTPTAVAYRVSGNKMEIAIPLSSLGITDPDDFSVDFKWIDNAVATGDIKECMRDGDSAPNGRFRYRYTFRK